MTELSEEDLFDVEEPTVHRVLEMPPELQRELIPSMRPEPPKPSWWERVCTPYLRCSPLEVFAYSFMFVALGSWATLALLWKMGMLR